jgi:hypothetical protein
MNEMHAVQEQGLGQDLSSRITRTEYDAQILKLRLPEQDALKNYAERCSADPVVLNSIGRAVGHQVRIKRKDDPLFFALYTVKQPNPPADLRDPSRANVVHTGQAGRERLGTPAEMKVVVHATVVDSHRYLTRLLESGSLRLQRTTSKLTSSPSRRMVVELKNTLMKRPSASEKDYSQKGIRHPRGFTKGTVTISREHLTAGTSPPPIYIPPASHCCGPLLLGSSVMVSHSMAFQNNLAKPMSISAEEQQNT